MPEPSDENVAQLSQGAWIDQVADRFDAAWQSGAEPRIADFLSNSDGPARRDLLRELVAIDQEYRTKRGSSKAWEEYVTEFPELAMIERTGSVSADTTQPRLRSPAVAARSRPHEPRCGQAAAGENQPPDPESIGKYRVLKRLGGGGQATAYLVYDPDLSQSVVLKLSHEATLPGEEGELRNEGQVLAELSHPQLVRVLHYGLFEERPYLVMEHIAGQNLAQWAGVVRPAHREAALLVAKIAEALAAAHRRGVIHRDLKPANVLIDEQGQPRVIDFGLAWHRHVWDESSAHDSVVAGTVAYMPPEQARGQLDRISSQSDIFGLGGILYFLLTGQSLFMEPGERDFQRVLARAKRCEFDALRLQMCGAPEPLQQICLRALAADPQDRYATADEMAAELFAQAETGKQTRRALLVAGAVAAGGIGLALYVGTRQQSLPPVDAPVLSVRLWRDGQLMPSWSAAAPLLGERDELQLRWKLPEVLATDLYLINGKGELKSLAEGLPATGLEQAYPEAGGRAPLTGPRGTEAILLCARRKGGRAPRWTWLAKESWPAVADESAYRLTPAGLATLQKSRDLGPSRIAHDPEETIRQRLEVLRERLTKDYHYFEAIVFAHK